MKKLLITLLSALALAIAFTGCGGGSAGSLSSTNVDDGGSTNVSPTVSDVEVSDTTPNAVPYKLTSALGTPPGLPG